ncbi:MAG: electron transfer flavoprotein-ubiquinone oxidoreductase [Pseudomonadota bacterium]
MSEEAAERESMEFDVVIVGAGPAGLSAAIKLKQLNADLNIVVLEKGPEVGAHILSGAVVDPIGVDRLLPDWRDEEGHPFQVPVTSDKFNFLTKGGKIPLPTFAMPKFMDNHGNYIVSLGNVCRWLAEKAEALEVEVYPGFAAAEIVYNEDGSVKGVATGDMGLQKDGTPGPMFERGMELHGKYVLFGEGARGSLSKQLIHKFNLDKDSNPPKFGIGFKELWEVDPSKHAQGTVLHSLGWPLQNNQDGGSFVYHIDNNQVYVGYVVALGYKNPYLSPFQEFQRFKTHPSIAPLLEGAKRISYGSRAITQGGWQSVPRLSFPGGALLGCAAGFVNVPRIKGSHNAMLSGILAAEHVVQALSEGRGSDELVSYEEAWRESEIGKDLKPVRNVKPLVTKYGSILGTMFSGMDMWLNTLFGWTPFGTMKHEKADYQATEALSDHQPIEYPKSDGKITFDRLSSVFLSNTNHAEEQPAHLKVADLDLQKQSELMQFAGPSTRYCPAGVYEWVDDNGDAIELGKEADANGASFVINFQNCVHCKTCDIKDPNQNINWTVPQGGEGPVYPNM